MLGHSLIIAGPNEDYDIPRESIGKYFFNCLKRRKQDEPLNLDYITGEITTNGQVLQNSVKTVKVFDDLHLKRGDVIALLCENNVNYCLPLLASFYMGVAVHCLNPSYSTGELKHALKLSKAKLMICSQTSIDNALKIKDELGFIETVLFLRSSSSSQSYPHIKSLEGLLKLTSVDVYNYEPKDFNPADQNALILMSSGTTGLPKGVQITHQNLRTSIGCIGSPAYLAMTLDTITVCVLPFFHIFGLLEQFGTICYGMKAVIIEKFRPNIFLGAIHDYKATKLYLVPPLISFLANSPLVEKYDLSSIVDIFSGGAPLTKDIEESLKKRISIKVRQVYGLTEFGCAATVTPPFCDKVGSVGVLIPGMYMKVLNCETNQIVGPRKIGELCFKGPNVMKEYIENEDQPRAFFDKDRFYHSGDMGYYDKDGYVYVIDRLKEIVKYKGFQVPPAELENLLMTHPAITDCGVIGISDKRAGEVPLAFVVRQDNVNVTEQEIIDFVAERISTQKHLYGGVRFIDKIPRTISGKILRKQLKEIFKTSQ